MKTESFLSRRCRRRGWSLIELLFVIAIMVALAGLMAASIGPVNNTVSRHRTRGLIKMLETGLVQFEAEYGSFPRCADYNDGAHVLYRTLFGDYGTGGKQDGVPDWSENNQGGAMPEVKTFVFDLKPGTVDPTTGTTDNRFLMSKNDSFYLVDAWGDPIYYQGGRGSDGKPLAKYNPTYDIWSTGNGGGDSAKFIKNW